MLMSTMCDLPEPDVSITALSSLVVSKGHFLPTQAAVLWEPLPVYLFQYMTNHNLWIGHSMGINHKLFAIKKNNSQTPWLSIFYSITLYMLG